LTNGKRRTRFNPVGSSPSRERSKGLTRSGGKGGLSQSRVTIGGVTNPAGKRSFGRSGGKGGGSFATSDLPRRRQPQNPHDPTSKDPFMRAGMGMGRNKSKIMKRAGMNMM